MLHQTLSHRRTTRTRFAALLLAFGLALTSLPAATLAAPSPYDSPASLSSSASAAPLQYQSSASNDPLRALLDAYATEADILSAYMDQIDNEAYIGTACDQPC
jgi:hypothetical protein